MGLFDKIVNTAANAINNAAQNNVSGSASVAGTQTASGDAKRTVTTIQIAKIPQTIDEFKAMPQAALSSPFDTAAMAVVAFCLFPQSKELCYKAVDYLRGPRPLSGMDKQFINDRFMDGQDYVPRSYFNGAVPDNDYTPNQPLTLDISAGPYAYQEEGYARLELRSGGADSLRSITLRHAKDGKWYLWEQFILVGIRRPESANPWG